MRSPHRSCCSAAHWGRFGSVGQTEGRILIIRSLQFDNSVIPTLYSLQGIGDSVADLPGHLTEQEIRAQPRLWADVLASFHRPLPQLTDLWRSAAPDQVLLTGCCSSYYLALSAAHLLQAALRVPCRAFPSSEVLFAGEGMRVWTRPPLLIAISRSGETTETVWALQRLRAQGATTVLV